ncbi:MAG TPA: aldo/keto reductase [Acidimicrobiales bacterium]|nr:aldo/keto reductase [Acidimicrobiales bacterium]
MNYRMLGKTHLQVSELGYGAWGIGKSMWLGAEDDESLKALRRAIDGGVNFLDTALVYGDGHSEKLVGQAVRDSAETVYVASKVPPANWSWPASGKAGEAYPGKWVVECTERSLSNLGLDTIDVQQFHVWSDDWVGQDDWLEAVQQLKLDGKIRTFGVSINDHQPGNAIELVRSGVVDTVQVIYNIFDQSPEDELFAAVLEHNVGVIVRVPFDEGSLAGRVTPGTHFPEGDFRNSYFGGDRRQQVWDHVEALVQDLGITLEQLPELALRFTLSHPAVSTVIPGMRSMRSVEANLAAEANGHLGDAELEVLRRHRWIRNFYQAPEGQ